jgi:surface protein
MCPNAAVGESGDPGTGILYTKRNYGGITLQNASTTCTSGITNMNRLFEDETTFNEDISSWDVSNVTDMQMMFDNYNSGGNFVFNQDLSYWDTSNVTDMSSMFRDCYVFNSDLSNWETVNVSVMWSMFEFALDFNSDISLWNVSNVTGMSSMFLGADSFNQPVGSWDVSNVTDMLSMFWGWDVNMSFDQDLSDWEFNPAVSLGGFLDLSGMSTINYDLLLESLNNQGLGGRQIGVEGLIFCNEASRNALVSNGWLFEGDSALEVIFNAPQDLIVEPDNGLCTATNVDLGQPILQACRTATVTNNAPAEFPLGITEVAWNLVDGNGVSLSDTQLIEVVLPSDEADICFVTAYWNNPINNRIWISSDPNLNGLNVSFHEVFRETPSGEYESIGVVYPPDDAFLDSNSNNNTQAYRYKLQTTDVCGQILTLSDYHKTILLQSSIAVDNSVNLAWNPYIGVSYDSYDIHKRVNGGNWELLASLSSANTAYNDTSADVVDNFYEYYVSISIASCNGNNPLQGFTLRSNFNNVNPNLVIKDNSWLSSAITFYPNPTSGYLNISINEGLELDGVTIYNALGQKVSQTKGTTQIDVSHIPSGIYYLSISTDQGTVNKTMVRR